MSDSESSARRLRSRRVHMFAAAMALSCAAISAAAPARGAPGLQPAGAIEATYFQAGPHAVDKRAGTDCCSSTAEPFDIWYPADLGANGERHSIIAWGDGTLAHPREYDYLLSHLASWGFVVIAPDLTSTGTGDQMLDGVNYLTQRNADPDSVFHDKLDTDSVAAVGHSQGGLGTLNAMAKSNGLIKTGITLEMPSQGLCTSLPPLIPGQDVCHIPVADITSGSILLIGGTADPVSGSGPSLYDTLPAALPKARALLVNASHNDIQGQPGCTNLGCNDGVNGYLGYVTAWLMDQLRGDARAHGAFVSGTGELMHNNQWADTASTIAD